MKKIIIVITDITGCGGTERTTCNIANTFAANGHEVTIISLFQHDPLPKFQISSSVKVEFCIKQPYNLSLSKLFRLKLILKAKSKLKQLLKEKDDTFVISQCFLPSSLIWLNGYARRSVVCEHFKHGIYGKLICKMRDCIYGRFRLLILLTNNEIEKYQYAVGKINIIPNMVLPQKGMADINSKNIISVGRLSNEKGFDMLIKAAEIVRKSCPQYQIEIYGNGGLEAELKNMILERKLTDYITIKDFSNDIFKIMTNSSLFVMSSRFEALPMVLLEAMSAGMPIVSFNCPTGPAYLLKNEAGILVEPENVQALAEAIVKVANDSDCRKKLSENAKKRIEEFSPDNVYRLWLNVINE